MCRRRTFTLALLLVTTIVPASAARQAARTPTVRPGDLVADVLALTNAERTRARVAPLRSNMRLTRAAQLHAEQMAKAKKLGHVLGGARYPQLEDRLAAVAYAWMATAENVASGQRDAAHVVREWTRSRSHRRNILNPVFTELGVGRALDADGRSYYVQVFGRPAE